MTEHPIEPEPRWNMHQVHQRRICQTPGCDRYVIQSRLAVYCLVCELDRNTPPPRTGRPRTTDVPRLCQHSGCTSPVETYCPLCEQFFCRLHDELYPDHGHDCLSDHP